MVQIDNYIHRPDSLDALCLFEFVREFELMTRRTAAKRGVEFESLKQGHALCERYVIARRTNYAVPSPTGKQIPPPDSVDADKVELRAKMMLLMFLPFRERSDIRRCLEEGEVSAASSDNNNDSNNEAQPAVAAADRVSVDDFDETRFELLENGERLDTFRFALARHQRQLQRHCDAADGQHCSVPKRSTNGPQLGGSAQCWRAGGGAR